MTVSANVPRADYIGNGSVAKYLVPFTLFAPMDLVVHVGGERQTFGVDYTVVRTFPGTNTNVVFLPGHIPAADAHIILEGATPITQPVDLGAGERFYEDTVERMADRNTVLIKQLNARVLKLALGSETSPGESGLEFPASEPGGYIRYKADGTGLETTLNVDADTLDGLHAGDLAPAVHNHDHGELAGLSDDDHPQYIRHSLAVAADDFLVASGAGTFAKKTPAEVRSILNVEPGGVGITDHGQLNGLGDDDHKQYLLRSEYVPGGNGGGSGTVRTVNGVAPDGDTTDVRITRFATQEEYDDLLSGDLLVPGARYIITDAEPEAAGGGGGGGVTDHGRLNGLGDDDHPQYIRHSLAAAADDFLVASGAGTFAKKTPAEVRSILNVEPGGGGSGTVRTVNGVAPDGDTTDVRITRFVTQEEYDDLLSGDLLVPGARYIISDAEPEPGGGGGDMVYPDAGIAQSTGTAWGTSLSLDTSLTGPFAADTSVPSSRATKSSVDALTAQISSLTARISDLEAISGGDNVVGTGAGVPLLTMIWGTTGVVEPGYFDISQNDGPLLRAAYPDAWAKIAEYGIAISDADWLSEYAANNNAIGKYSSGDGSTTFRLPVISKRFIRATDTGLPIGTAQGDAIRNIEGETAPSDSGGIDSIYGAMTVRSSGAFSSMGQASTRLITTTAMPIGGGKTANFDASLVVPTAEENRPVAIVFTPLLRVGKYVEVEPEPPESSGSIKAMAWSGNYEDAGESGSLINSWTHNPDAQGVGAGQSPAGVLVCVHNRTDSLTGDYVTGVTYGGVAMTEVPGSPMMYNAPGESPMQLSVFFLGSGVPSGSQSVTVQMSEELNNQSTAISFEYAGDTMISAVDFVGQNSAINRPLNNPVGTDSVLAMCATYTMYGGNTVISPAGWNQIRPGVVSGGVKSVSALWDNGTSTAEAQNWGLSGTLNAGVVGIAVAVSPATTTP